MTNTKQQTAVKQIKKYLELPHRETVITTNTIQTKPFDNQKTMSNNKQSSVEWLIEQLKEYDFSEEDDTYVIKIQSWVLTEKHEKANAMHKEEIIEANEAGFDDGNGFVEEMKYKTSGHYYNETFGNEQQ
jgi:hypothetical protein